MSQDTSVHMDTLSQIVQKIALVESPAATLPLLHQIATEHELPLSAGRRRSVAAALFSSFGKSLQLHEKQTSSEAVKMVTEGGDLPVVYQMKEQLELLGFVFADVAANTHMAAENAASVLCTTAQNGLYNLHFYDANAGTDELLPSGERLTDMIREHQAAYGDELDIQISFEVLDNMFYYREPGDPYDALEAYLVINGEVSGSSSGAVAIRINKASGVREAPDGTLVLYNCRMQLFCGPSGDDSSILLQRLSEDISRLGCLDGEIGRRRGQQVWIHRAVFDPKTNRFLEVDVRQRLIG